MPGSESRSSSKDLPAVADPGGVLQALEDGAITVDRAVSLLAAPMRARRRPAAWVRLELTEEGRHRGIRIPAVAAAVLLVGVESVVYPAAWGVLQLLGAVGVAGPWRKIAAGVPAFPLSRIALAVIASGAPLRLAAQDDDHGVLISVE